MSVEVGAELVFDIRETFPLLDEVYDEVYLFHTIEHIEKKHHTGLFSEIRRVLKRDGRLIVTFPEFGRIVANWLANKNADRAFWENTIFGRQLYPSDYHVCAIDSLDFKQFLSDRGFEVIKITPEPLQDCNTIVEAKLAPLSISYEELLYNEIFAGK